MGSQTSIPQLLAQMKAAHPANDQERQALYQAARELMLKSEDGLESITRITYSPQLLYVHRIGIDLGLFTKLVDAKGPVSVAGLSQSTNADPVLLNRILRFLASHSSVEQVDSTHYQANAITRAVASENWAAGIDHSSKTVMLAAAATPDFLAENNYRNPDDQSNNPFTKAMNINIPPWEWSLSQPELTASFAKFMSAQYRPHEFWANAIDVAGICKGSTSETPIFVDVGGSIGHQSVGFKQHFPDIPGRVIVQDLKGPIIHSIPFEGVEKQIVDFWQPQQVKNARIYYLRQILHDFPDDKCVELLKITKAAMGPESVIALDEMVVPDTNAHWRATAMDINMMSSLAALERTETEWAALLPKAGLKIKEIKKYVFDTAASIILAVPS